MIDACLPTITCSYRFIGTVKDISEIHDSRLGDITICGDTEYVYDGDKWQSIGPIESTVPENNYPTHCKCCGAPLHSWKCEYCGVEY